MYVIFNSKKEFWNNISRCFQSEFIFISDFVNAKIEFSMARNADSTADILVADDSISEITAKEFIENIEFDEDRLDTIQDMHKSLKECYECR